MTPPIEMIDLLGKSIMLRLSFCPACQDTYLEDKVVTPAILNGREVFICDDCVAEFSSIIAAQDKPLLNE